MKLTPVALTLTSSSPLPGGGDGASVSSRTSGPPSFETTIAFIVALFVAAAFGRPRTQLTIEHEQSRPIAADHLELFDDQVSGLLLFYLLCDEPLQGNLSGEIVCGGCYFVEMVDHPRHLLLVFERALEHVER